MNILDKAVRRQPCFSPATEGELELNFPFKTGELK